MCFKKSILMLSTAMFIYSPASFAFEWMEETPVYIFGEPPSDAKSRSQSSADNASAQKYPNNRELEQQINQIDLEILILKAELALQSSDLKGLQFYLSELDKVSLPQAFAQRVNELKQALQSVSPNPILRFLGMGQNFSFPMYDANAIVAVVLPMSGRYSEVSTTLLESLRESLRLSGFQGRLIEFDTMAYPNMFRLWDRMRTYQPNFIFGPLQKESITEWHQLDTGIPTLYFNTLDSMLNGYEKSLSPSLNGQVRKVSRFLSNRQVSRSLVIHEPGEKGRELAQTLQADWMMQNPQVQLFFTEQEGSASQSLADGLGVVASENRAAVLKNILRRPVEFSARARQDIEAVISLVEPKSAIQVSPLLSYYGLQDVPHFWYPAKSLQVQDLNLYLNSWQKTTGFIPPYVYQAFLDQEYIDETKTGIFYALGQVAVEIVNQSEFLAQKDWLLSTGYGQIEANQDGRFYLLPSVYWLDNNQISPLDAETK